jgi:intron-binding protein aquarius
VDYSVEGRVDQKLAQRIALLAEVKKLSDSLKVTLFEEFTCETAAIFFKYHVQSRWDEFLQVIAQGDPEKFPFKEYASICGIEITKGPDFVANCEAFWRRRVVSMFEELEECRIFELIRSRQERMNYIIYKCAKIVAMTNTRAAMRRNNFVDLGFEFDNVIIEEAGQLQDILTYLPITMQKNPARLKRLILIGDNNQLPPVTKSILFHKYSNLEQSMFKRLIRLGVPVYHLKEQGRTRDSILQLYSWRYPDLKSLDIVNSPQFQLANAGLAHEYQFVEVPDYDGQGESEPRPHFYQNLGEAEFVIGFYMYLVLIGYSSEKITILTTYNGQKDLLRDIYKMKCSFNTRFKKVKITTVDKYQGQQNDIVILSLVRTRGVGHVRDLRRLVVAMSRARLGLYVFGRFSLFNSYIALRQTLDHFSKRPPRLALLPSERYQAMTRKMRDTVRSGDIVSVGDFEEMYSLVQQLLKIS